MAEAVTIRRAVPADGTRVAALWLRLLDEHAALDGRFGYAADARTRFENDFPVWLRNQTWRLVVAEAGGEIVGFVSAQRWAPPPVYAYSEEVYLNELYVAPEARRQGLGRRLVEAVRGWAEELHAGRLRLGVLSANTAGCAFWEAVGGQPLSLTYTLELAPAPAPGAEKKSKKLGF
jgi:GNAT superfamily N-acetyltransferase